MVKYGKMCVFSPKLCEKLCRSLTKFKIGQISWKKFEILKEAFELFTYVNKCYDDQITDHIAEGCFP